MIFTSYFYSVEVVFLYIICAIIFTPGEEDRGWWVWGDLRGDGPDDAGQRGTEGGVGPAAQTGAEDGGRGAQEAPGWVQMDSLMSLIGTGWSSHTCGVFIVIIQQMFKRRKSIHNVYP